MTTPSGKTGDQQNSPEWREFWSSQGLFFNAEGNLSKHRHQTKDGHYPYEGPHISVSHWGMFPA